MLPLSISYPVHPDCRPGEYCSAKTLQCVLLTLHPKWNSNCSRNEVVPSNKVCGEFTPPISTTPYSSSNPSSSRETLLKQQVENSYQQNVLQCIHHKCRQCEEQSRNFSNGMICVNGMWQFERYSNSIVDSYYDLVFKRDATSIVLVVSMVIFVFTTVVSVSIDMTRIIQRKRQVAELEMEMASNEEFMEYYSQIMEKERSKRAKKMKERMKALNGNIMSSSDDDEDDHHESSHEEDEGVSKEPSTPLQSRIASKTQIHSSVATNNEEGTMAMVEEDHSSQPRVAQTSDSRSTRENSNSTNVQRPLPLTPIQRGHQKSLQKAIERSRLSVQGQQNEQSTRKEEFDRNRSTVATTSSQQQQPRRSRPLPSTTNMNIMVKPSSISHHSDSDEY
ncbi:hypothetical protein C9374_000295 [Naegleria lovaniensis]|uniref:Uncharacterized protein n=1 Tax=Naegleria lovaniensis TaxID=51637 RepID=A0AA88KPQ5_NAELO|nr:uncharacterized protein C9374_000295 [Naegleria lovaniensis]KAG2388856.1 hypothetical protein C9374_000295 [Naegleria lovaniensis]